MEVRSLISRVRVLVILPDIWKKRTGPILLPCFLTKDVRGLDVANDTTNSALALYTDMGGVIFATPSTSEKGYFDMKITLSTLGGHSSVPPSHTVRINYTPYG